MADRSLIPAGQPVTPGFFARLSQAARYAVSGTPPAGRVDRTGFFGPMEPMADQAPPDVRIRAWDYQPGVNLYIEPRAEAHFGFHELRALAVNYDLVSLAIGRSKAQVLRNEWTIRAIDKTKRKQKDDRVAAISDFLTYPDRENSWDQWLGILLDDLLVIDAPTIFPRMTNGGELYALEYVDGSTIKPVIDDHGRRPLPPLPAYQQVLKGIVANSYDASQLIYLPRNKRAWSVYGYSPVEQIVMTVNIALRRQLHQLEFYTEGTAPDMIVGVPDTWTPQQTADFQAYFDALLGNSTAQRRKARFVPAGVAKNIVFTKEQALKDEYDEWLARIVCYAFGVSYQWAVKQMNRATAENASNEAQDEGLAPLLRWVKGALDRVLRDVFKTPDLEFAWLEEIETDALKKAQVDEIKLRTATKKINEVREEDGLEPDPNGNELLIYTAQGAVLLKDIVNPQPEPTEAQTDEAQLTGEAEAPDGADTSGRASPKGGQEKAPPAGDSAEGGKKKPLAKASGRVAKPIDRNRPAAQRVERELLKIWSGALAHQGKAIAGRAAELAPTLTKADDDDADDDPFDPVIWDTAAEQTRKQLEEMAQDGAAEGAIALGVSTDLANSSAVAWASDRAAKLVSGLKRTTRADLRALIAKSESEGWSVAQLSGAIENDFAFSASRAALIAHMETRTADNMGSLIAGKAAKTDLGLDVRKRWLPRGDNVCPACLDNETDGAIAIDDTFSSGADTAPAHVNCECDVEQEIAEGAAAGKEGE